MVYLLVMALGLWAASAAGGQPRFRASLIEGQGAEVLYCDVDGDRLEDVVMLDGSHASVFYQTAERGFSRTAEVHFNLGDEPGILWAAGLGPEGGSLLLASSNGVSELCFTNRSAPPMQRQIIEQPTAIPSSVAQGDRALVHFQLSAGTKEHWPVILLPVPGGLQVWQRRPEWQPVQLLRGIANERNWPALRVPGYSPVFGLEWSIGDLDGDGREDLLVGRTEPNGEKNYRFYPQRADGTFAPDAAMSYTEQPERESWLCWVDMNRDGQVDLVKGIASGDPWFFPGSQSRKVLVGAYVADAAGRIPSRPQYVFRKNDGIPAVPLADIDGDGYPDLALGSAPLDTREGLRQMITAKQLPLTLKLHFYRPGIGYRTTPDCQMEVVFGLDQRLLALTLPGVEHFERMGNLNGDFDGDGKKDLLVRERSDEISVYPFVSRDQGFSREPKARFHCGDLVERLAVRDLNGDGISDLVVKLQKPGAVKVFISSR